MNVKKGERERKQKKKTKQCRRFFRLSDIIVFYLLWTHGKCGSEKNRNIVKTFSSE